ncbi:MAG: NAD(P)/FAD-dependent oxidoreductase [Pirellulales bacterium]
MSTQAREQQAGSVIVAGGGIVGLACAHYLRQSGFEVTLLDQGEVGGECSRGNCGYICPSHVAPLTEPGAIKVALRSLFNPRSPFRVKPRLSPALAQWMLQFAVRCTHAQVLSAGKHLQAILNASIAEYRALMASEQLACEWQETGLLYVFENQRPLEAFAAEDRLLTEHFGLSATRIPAADLPDFDPGLKPGLAGGFHYPGDASVRPDRLNASWSERLRSRGVRILERCVLNRVLREGNRILGLDTSQGRLSADRYVFALGARSTLWSKQLGISIPIEPGKGYSLTIPRPEHCPMHPILFPEQRVGVSPFEHGMRLGSMMEFAGYDTTIPAYRLEQLRAAARRYLVAAVDAPAEETWFGWRPMTWDSLPIIGPVAGLADCFLATGHNMIGVTLAPATGRLIAELVSGQTPFIDASPYSADRLSS